MVRGPGAFLPLVGMEIERQGFDAVYLSGATLSAGLGLPDIGLTTLTEVADHAEQLARATNLPLIVDCDTGFGDPMNLACCVETMERRGVAGVQIEDQKAPKRCGHLDGKSLVSTQDMVRRVRTAAEVRQDPNLLVIARTDAWATKGGPGNDRPRAGLCRGRGRCDLCRSGGGSSTIAPGTGVRVYLACAVTDMRKGIVGLVALSQDVLRQKPSSGAVFALRRRRGDRIKLLLWDGQGFCLYCKVPERGRFPWPTTTEGAARLTSAQLAMRGQWEHTTVLTDHR